MKTSILNPVFLFLALVGVAAADLPKKQPITKYASLWTNSPFTVKPPPVGPDEPDNPLDDYALIGVSSLGVKNYLVTLINKKKPDEPRIYVETNRESKGFKIIKVTRKQGDPLGTVVHMQSGSMTGTVSYDSKLLTLAAAPKAAPPQAGGAPQIPGQPPQPQPGADGQGRQPRPRVVPPPATAGQVQPGQVQPQVQQGQVQQGQPNQAIQQNRGNNNNQRPQRRGN
ncbi:MAG: hypothetical protein V4819_05650 [Verrucomicrobiota bacterium]